MTTEPKYDDYGKFFAHEVIKDKENLRKMLNTKGLLTNEMNFLSEALYEISQSSGLLDEVIHKIIEIDFEENNKNIFRINTLGTKMLDIFINERARGFLKIILKEPINVVLQDENIQDVEIEKNKVYKRIVGSGKSFSDVSPINPNYTKVYTQVKTNSTNLSNCIKIFTNYMFSDDCVRLLPFELKVICRYIYDLSEKFECDPLPRVGSLIILRMFGPAILFPKKNGVVKKNQEISSDHRRALMLITKVIQLLSNRSKSEENMMNNLTEVIDELQQKCAEFFKKICISREEIEKKKSILTKILKKSYKKKTINEVSLFVYNFLLYKKIKVQIPNVKGFEYGKIAYTKLFHIKNPKKKKKKSNCYKYCVLDNNVEESAFEKLIDKLYNEDIKKSRTIYNGDTVITDLPGCKKFNIKVCVIYSGSKHSYFFSVVKGNYSENLIIRCLRNLVREFEPKTSSYEETIELIHHYITDYNAGRKFNPKDLLPFFKCYLLQKSDDQDDDDDEEEEEEKSVENEEKSDRTFFKNLPTYQNVVLSYNKEKKKPGFLKKLFASTNSNSVADEW